MKPLSLPAVLLALLLCSCGGGSPESERAEAIGVPDGNVRVGAFNMQNFGPTKSGRPEVMTSIATLITEYDALVLQEIEDISGQSQASLLARVNQISPKPYELALSGRLGRSNNKEQYGLIYRPDRISLVQTLQLDDPEDEFEREPFVFHVSSGGQDYGLIALHAKPDDAVAEINKAAFAYDAFLNATGVDSAFVIGDLNADCDFASDAELRATALCSDPRFSWLISDAADTTTGTTHCAYDRIVVRGPVSQLLAAPAVYRFDRHLDISAASVSDHYPVEVEIGSAGGDYSGFTCAPGGAGTESPLASRTSGAAAPFPTPLPVVVTPAPPRPSCCRVCSTGKACGDSCIARSSSCSIASGCACNG